MRTLAKLTWMELKLFAREPFALVFAFGFPLVVLVVLAGVFGSAPDPDFGGETPVDYYLAGYIGVVISVIGLVTLPVHVAAYRERGILRRFRASSVPSWAVVGAQVVTGLAIALLGGLVLVAFATLLYDAALPESPGGVLVAFVVGSVSMMSLGLLVATVMPNARAAQAVGMILFFPMWLLSGAGPPPSVLSEGMRQLSDLLPLTYVVRALQGPWLGQGLDGGDLLVLIAVLIAAGLLSVRLFRAA